MDCLFGFCYTFLYTENNTNGNNKHFIKKKKNNLFLSIDDESFAVCVFSVQFWD